MDSFKKWLWAISSCSIFVLFGTNLGLNNLLSNAIVFFILSYPFFKYTISEQVFVRISKYIFLHIIGLILVLFNIVFSYDPINSLQYWIIYLVFIYGFNSWLNKIKREKKLGELLLVLKKNLSIYMFINLVIIYLGITLLGFGNLKTYNTFGIITGSVLVYFWFLDFKNVKIKYFLILILLYFLIISLSRSSLICAFLAIFGVELILFKKSSLRKFFLLFFVFVVIYIFNDKLMLWFSEKQSLDETEIKNISDLISLNEDRDMLIQNFFSTYMNNYFTGYGVNYDYQNLSEWNSTDNVGVHNGILDMILVVGIPLSLVFIFYFFKAFKRTLNWTLKDKSYSALFGFLLYCLIRSYGESYFLLNIGNQMSVFFIIILIVFYNFAKKA